MQTTRNLRAAEAISRHGKTLQPSHTLPAGLRNISFLKQQQPISMRRGMAMRPWFGYCWRRASRPIPKTYGTFGRRFRWRRRMAMRPWCGCCWRRESKQILKTCGSVRCRLLKDSTMSSTILRKWGHNWSTTKIGRSGEEERDIFASRTQHCCPQWKVVDRTIGSNCLICLPI